MKVLMVIKNMRADSGVCASVAAISNGLSAEGHEVYVASLLGTGAMSERLDIPKRNIIDLSDSRTILGKAFSLRRHIKQRQFDVVHTHMHQPGVVGYLASIGTKSARVITEHSTYMPVNKWRKGAAEDAIDSLLARSAQGLIAVSRSVAATYATRIQVYPNSIDVIYNAVDTERFRRTNRKRSKKLAPKILFAGRFAYEKNAPLAIKVLQELRRRGLGARLFIAGSGLLHEELEEVVNDSGLRDYVVFLGAVTNMPSLMRDMDALLLTSYWEGCPMSILEAYASGLPVIATRVAGVIDVVDNLTSGVLMDPRQPERSIPAMVRLFNDPVFAKELADNAYDKLDTFSTKEVADSHISLYLRAVERKANRSYGV